MKTLALVLALVCSTQAKAHTPSTAGIGWDKMLHFGAGYIASDLMRECERKLEIEDKYNIGPFLITTIMASVKEATDAQWDWADWNATMLGAHVQYTINF